MSQENAVAVGEQVVPVKPIGFEELLKWYVPRARKGYTLAQCHAEYPGVITKDSLSVKLSNLRRDARKMGLKDVPELARERGGRAAKNIDVQSLAAELNLSFLTEDEEETEETAQGEISVE